MKNMNRLNLIIYTFLFIAFTSCNNDDDNPPANPLDEISDIATFHGNLDGDIVVIVAQGGPSTTLEDGDIKEVIGETETESALWVNVHQVQTKDPNQFTGSDITFEQAKQFDLQSTDYLKRVVDFFKNQQGKTVYVIGVSFGSFVVQDLIAAHGVDIADGYLILGNRLDVDDFSWQNHREGQFVSYIYDDNGDYTIELENDPDLDTIEQRNMAKLIAGFAFNRYTERLANNVSLSKVTYIYGSRDEVAGPLSAQELEFLNEKGANIGRVEGGAHDDAIGTGVNILKEVFGIE
jgi:hypothetical protein